MLLFFLKFNISQFFYYFNFVIVGFIRDAVSLVQVVKDSEDIVVFFGLFVFWRRIYWDNEKVIVNSVLDMCFQKVYYRKRDLFYVKGARLC